jgi:hypothetical protein
MLNRCNRIAGLVLFMVMTFVCTAFSAGPVETMLKGCQTELETKCQDVTPGEGRILACLYAYQDQLSGQCEYALYDGAVQLEQAIMSLTHVANECHDDLMKYCAKVEVGEGRVLSCLEEHDSEISKSCKQAIKEVGLK